MPEAARIAARIRRLFDLDADPAAIRAQLRRDAALAPRLRRAVACACRARGTLRARRARGARSAGDRGRRLHARRPHRGRTRREARRRGRRHRARVPGAATLAAADLSGLGLTGARCEALGALARAVASGALELEGGQAPDEVRRGLLALPGVGPWTAEYVALRALGEPDAFPASDLGLRRALGPAGQPLTTQALEERAKGWQPWRSYAAVLLWSSGHD